VFQKKVDLLFGICAALVIFWFVWEARSWSFHSRLFPWSIGLSVLALALVQVVISVRQFNSPPLKNNADSTVTLKDEQIVEIERPTLWRVATITCWIAFFLLGIWLLGFRLGSLILTVAFLKFAADEEYKKYLSLGLANYLFFLLIFDLTLGVPLFEGALAQWLGIEALDRFLAHQVVRLWH
jgi:hypothetical protein